MSNLSPQAQAVLDAAVPALNNLDAYGFNHQRYYRNALAAALRAAADQVVPDEPHPEESQYWDVEGDREWQSNQHFRKQLLAIATELDTL